MARSARDQIGVDLPDPTPVEQIQVEQQETEDTRPEWLPEKFDSPQGFVQSYSELERELKQRAEEQKALEQQVERLTEAVQAWNPGEPQQNNQSVDSTREQLLQMHENDPVGTIAFLAQQAADQRIQAALQQLEQSRAPQDQQSQQLQNQMLAHTVDSNMQNRHDDWETYKPKVQQLIEQDQWLLPEQVLNLGVEATTNALERVYAMAKSQDVLAAVERGDYDAVRDKRMAQTLSGNGGRGGEVDVTGEKMAQLQAAVKGISYSALRG